MIFIDELDALGKARGRGFAAHDEVCSVYVLYSYGQTYSVYSLY